jgi:hypothetical protein
MGRGRSNLGGSRRVKAVDSLLTSEQSMTEWAAGV